MNYLFFKFSSEQIYFITEVVHRLAKTDVVNSISKRLNGRSTKEEEIINMSKKLNKKVINE